MLQPPTRFSPRITPRRRISQTGPRTPHLRSTPRTVTRQPKDARPPPRTGRPLTLLVHHHLAPCLQMTGCERRPLNNSHSRPSLLGPDQRTLASSPPPAHPPSAQDLYSSIHRTCLLGPDQHAPAPFPPTAHRPSVHDLRNHPQACLPCTTGGIRRSGLRSLRPSKMLSHPA